jgi:hypothetical protein
VAVHENGEQRLNAFGDAEFNGVPQFSSDPIVYTR